MGNQADTRQFETTGFLHKLSGVIRWTLSLSNKFRRQVPLATGMCILASLTSQTAMLVAFLLPLKVVILLGSDGLPSYYPPALAALGRETLILALSAASVGFYCLTLLAEYVVRMSSDRGAKRLLASTGKLILFENQNAIAGSAYKQLTSALAGSLFVVLAILVLLWIYPAIPLLLLAYLAVIVLIVAVLARQARIRHTLERSTVTWIGVATSLGFLLVFVGMVADFLIGTPPALTPAILALLLTRQLTNKIKTSSASLRKLLQKRAQIDALFFHRHILLAEPAPENTIWPLLLPEQRRLWMPQVLAAVAGPEWVTPTRISWWPMNEPHIAALHCEYQNRPGILLKLFERNQTRKALHEATLLSEPPPLLPAPVLLGITKLGEFHCHALQLPEQARPLTEVSEQQRLQCFSRLLSVQPGKTLAGRYCRSHPLLDQRLSENILQRLRAAADASAEPALIQAMQQREAWSFHLHGTALGFHTQVNTGNLIACADGSLQLLHWGDWTLEPCGFGWPLKLQNREALYQALSEAQALRTELASVRTDQLLLAALSATLEQFCRAGRPDEALTLLPPINDCLTRLERSRPAQ